MVNDPDFTNTVLENRRIELEALPSDEVNWIAPVFKDKTPDIRLFYQMLLDKKQYWGDECAIDILSAALNTQICVWVDKWDLIYAGEPSMKHTHLHVFKHTNQQHYSGVSFLFDIDR